MLVVASPQSVTCINVIGTPVAAAQVCDIALTTIIVETLSSTGQVRARTVFAFPGGLFEASLGSLMFRQLSVRQQNIVPIKFPNSLQKWTCTMDALSCMGCSHYNDAGFAGVC